MCVVQKVSVMMPKKNVFIHHATTPRIDVMEAHVFINDIIHSQKRAKKYHQ